MHTVSKSVFEQVLAANTTKSEPATERDGEYLYETWLGMDDEEIAFVAYSGGQAISWHVADHLVEASAR